MQSGAGFLALESIQAALVETRRQRCRKTARRTQVLLVCLAAVPYLSAGPHAPCNDGEFRE